jgi:transcriptional regulator with XRE-family HTH domain
MTRRARRHPGRVFDGEGLFIAREASFMTQSELAKKVGVTTRAVQRWESGESQPQFSAVRALAEVFAVSPEHLYEPADEPNGDPVEAAA